MWSFFSNGNGIQNVGHALFVVGDQEAPVADMSMEMRLERIPVSGIHLDLGTASDNGGARDTDFERY
jgi:hypothetical protein